MANLVAQTIYEPEPPVWIMGSALLDLPRMDVLS